MKQKISLHYKVRAKLAKLLGGGTPVRVAKRARILLLLSRKHSVDEVAERVGCGTATVKRVRRHYRQEGLERALWDAPKPGRPKKLQSLQERELIALACTDPPQGAARWSVRLLAKHCGQDISKATVHRILQEDGLKPWREKNVVCSDAGRGLSAAHDGRARPVRKAP